MNVHRLPLLAMEKAIKNELTLPMDTAIKLGMKRNNHFQTVVKEH